MKKLEEIQNRKTMSAYGGVGSIIETKDNGSLLIEFYNRWGCYGENGYGNHVIEDQRLLEYLQNHKGIPNCAELREIPTPDDINKYSTSRGDLQETIKSRYFPSWFFCRGCHRLHRYDTWRDLWENRWGNTGLMNCHFNDNFPACPYCSTQRGDTQISRKKLEQIRFCMASLDSGKIEDIPFGQLVKMTPKGNYYNVIDDISVETELEYRNSEDSLGLQSNYVKMRNADSARLTMAQLESRYIIYEGNVYKLVLRNQNNVYYPDIVRAIYIPQDERILQLVRLGFQADAIVNGLNTPENQIALTIEQVQNIIDGRNLDFDLQEYAYITYAGNYINGRNYKQDFYAMRFEHLRHRYVRRFYAIPRLREDSTIPGFFRISNKEKTWLNVRTLQEENMTPHYQSTFQGQPHEQLYIPVAKAFGEGFFLDIDTEHLEGVNGDDAYKFVHTFSHLLMKELEFECGYSIQSIKEKIYRNADNTAFGILIYTVGGSEGSYGGLVSLLPNDVNAQEARLLRIIDNALERAKDCPNDPICSAEGGHCFACVDIPEISCCDWNNNIDRNIVNRINAEHNNRNANEG